MSTSTSTTQENDLPPPYTPSPSIIAGETTVEQGPRTPFQTPSPPRTAGQRAPLHRAPEDQQNNRPLCSYSPASPPLPFGRVLTPPSIFQLLSQSVNSTLHRPPPPRHPLSPSVSSLATTVNPNSDSLSPPSPDEDLNRRHSVSGPPPVQSDFSRDFYAAGTGEFPANSNNTSPPSVSPRYSAGNSGSNAIPQNGRPTAQPQPGHPLLKDGKLLVYPLGFKCDKCENIGYKNADPLRPCKKCWSKYAKPFTGAVALSFSSPPSSSNPNLPQNLTGNFQRPLPFSPPPPPPSDAPGRNMPNSLVRSAGIPPPPNFGPTSGYNPGYINAPPPPPPTKIYRAGDPRIGGRMCWRCNGRGNVSFLLLERITCEVCRGVGRVFS